MPVQFSEGSEPLPGYRLKRYLGRGGFGEVWEAAAPGDIPIAIKFVRLEDSLSENEERELEIVRTVRHAHLLDVHFVRETDGYLVMGMPLCDQDLHGRLKECQNERLPGIPVEELLELMDINLAPNIEDNWPGSGDDKRLGFPNMTMGEESGRCYGRNVWLYESKKVRGSQKLKPPRSQDQMRTRLYQILGHAINDCLGRVTDKEELARAYNKDLKKMPILAKSEYKEVSEYRVKLRAIRCSEIIGVLISGEDDHLFPIHKAFPRTTAYLKKELLIN